MLNVWGKVKELINLINNKEDKKIIYSNVCKFRGNSTKSQCFPSEINSTKMKLNKVRKYRNLLNCKAPTNII